jgi:hypothetical protein
MPRRSEATICVFVVPGVSLAVKCAAGRVVGRELSGWVACSSLLRVRGRAALAAHGGLAFEDDAVGAGDEAVEDGVGDGRFADASAAPLM